VILIDSNIPMYLVGADEVRRAAAQAAVRAARAMGMVLVTDAEVYQEVLHRYTAIRRPEAIRPCVEVLDRLASRVLAIDRLTISGAMQILDQVDGLSARDAVHVAAARQHAISHLLSFDAGFDLVAGMTRLS
jgi:predicted nucleic acid-binding protein